MSSRSTSLSLRLLGALILAATATIAADQACGGSGGTVGLPSWGKKPTSGLQMKIHGQGIDGNGYRPVRVEVSPLPAGVFTEDRQIRVVLRPNEYYGGQYPEVSQIIELPEGATKAEATIAVPQTALWYQMRVQTFEGGDELDDLSQSGMGWANNNYWQWSEAAPGILLVDSNVPLRGARDASIALYQSTGADNNRTHTLPDIRTLAWIFPDPARGYTGGPIPTGSSPASNGSLSDTELLAHVQQNMGRVEMLPPAELPVRWIDLSQYDAITLSADELKALAKTQPQSLDAIRKWVRGGRVLLVYGAEADYARLKEIEQNVALAPLSGADEDASGYRGWKPPSSKVLKQELQGSWDPEVYGYGGRAQYMVQGGVAAGGAAGTVTSEPEGTSANSSTATQSGKATLSGQPPFLMRDAGLGTVVAMSSKNPFPGLESDWIWIFNSIPKNQWMWYQREGFSQHRLNDDYWMFLIPGVGEAPVISFLLLVSLFAVVIGPVNYIFLGKTRRLYLLLITVPLGAAIVTAGLFSYAVLTDGLGVRLRARSFAALDQRSQLATGWSRLSYFAAITPSQGFQFPEDATVFPLDHEPPNMTGNSKSQLQRLAWDGQQNLQSGYISARTPTQFMVERSTKTPLRLVVQEGKRAGQPPEVENQLDTDIRYLLLRDSRGDYYVLRSLAEAGKSKLEKIEPAAAEKELAKLHDAVRPDLPRGYDPAVHHNSALSWMMPDYRNYGSIDGGSSRPTMASSILETSLATALRPARHPPEPGTYVAITAESTVVPSGLKDPGEEASFHVLRGKY